MKQVTITCPFTGVDFEATEFADGSIVARNPLTNQEIRLSYNPMPHAFMLPKNALQHVETVSIVEAANLSNVSVQRISKLCADGVLQARILPDGSKVILLDELTSYNESKKNGRPRKDA